MSDLTWKDLTWEDVQEWKTKQYDCDGRLIQFDYDCINWLMEEVDQLRAEIERLKPLDQPLESNAHVIKSIATRCAEIAEDKTKYLSCSNDGHGIAEAIRKEFGL